MTVFGGNNMDQCSIEARISERRSQAEANRAKAKADEAALIAQYPSKLSVEDQAKVQFRHDSWHGHTYAVLTPDANILQKAAMQLLGGGKEVGVQICVGVSSLNAEDRDQYNRRVGRAVATHRLTPAIYKLKSVVVHEERTHYNLSLGNLEVHLYVSTGKNDPFLSGISDLHRTKPYHLRLRKGK